MVDTANLTKEFVLKELDRGAKEFSEYPISDLNPNVTYGDIYNTDQLKAGAIAESPVLQTYLSVLEGPDKVKQKIDEYNQAAPSLISFYDRPPSTLTEADIFPEYTARAQRYDREADRRSRETAYLRGNLPESFLEPEAPMKPMGYDTAMQIAARGFDPRKEIDIEGINEFRRIMAARGPYVPTPDDLNYAKQYLGTDLMQRTDNPDIRGKFAELLPGKFAYLNPKNPDLGTVYVEEGKEPALYDSPLFTGTDAVELFVQEAPLIGAEILIGGKGLKYFDEFLKDVPTGKNFARKALEGTAGNILLSGGVATTRFLQLASGSFTGVHNRDVVEMLEESGYTAMLAFAGNTAISAFTSGFPKVYRGLFGKDLSATDLKRIEEAISAKQTSAQGGKVRAIGGEEPVSLLEIDEALEKLSVDMVEGLKFKPTLAQASKDSYIADLEEILMSNINNPEYGKLYKDMLDGNEELIQDLFGKVFENLNNDTTGNTVAKSLTNLFGRKSENLQDQGLVIMAGIKQNIDNMKSASQGKNLLDQVVDIDASSKLIPRYTTRLNEISRNYKNQLSKDVNDAFDLPELADLKFTGRGFRGQIKAFENAGKQTQGLNVGRKEIEKTFKELFEPQVLERLTRYTDGDLTLRELNDVRIQLNSFASTLEPGKKVADQKVFQLSRDLQESIENTMFSTIRKNLPKDQANYVIETLNVQKYGTELANNQAIKDLLRTSPEEVVGYLFAGGKGKTVNTKANSVIDFLKTTNSEQEISRIRNDTVEFMKRNFFDDPDLSPVELSKNYRKFLEENRSTLRAIFPDDEFKGILRTRKDFAKNISEPLERLERKNRLLTTKFGEDTPFNIVTEILGTGSTKKASGELVDDLNFIDDLLESATGAEKEILQKQISDATKKYILMRSSVDGSFDVNMLNQFMNDGFAPAQLVGDDLSFKGVIGRLIDNPDDFFTNLEVMRDIGMRTSQDLTSPSAMRRQIREQVSDPGTEYLRRFFIPPLTQFGRRATALENLVKDRNIRFLSKVLTDDALFKRYVDGIKGTKKAGNIAKLLADYGIVHYTDIGSTAKFYDTVEKEQRPSRTQVLSSDMRDELERLQRSIGGMN
jgi:hypothetical protein